jgi:hypothetical protein
VFLVIVLGFTSLALLLSERRGLAEMLRSPAGETRPAQLLRAGLAVLSLLALGWLLRPYQHFSDLYGFHRTWDTIAGGLPQLWSYLMADRAPDSLPRLLDAVGSAGPEQQLFLGLPLLALFALGAALALRTRNRLGLLALVVIAGTFALTLLVDGNSLYWFVWSLPGLNALRVMTRLILVVLLPLSLAAALAIDWLLTHAQRPDAARGAAIAALVLMLGGMGAEVALYRPDATPIVAWTAAADALRSRLPPNLPSDAILLVTSPPDAKFYWPTDVSAMVVAQDLGLALINGYSGNFPPGYVNAKPCLTPAEALAGYFKFAAVPPSQQQALLARVVVVAAPSASGGGLAACPE